MTALATPAARGGRRDSWRAGEPDWLLTVVALNRISKSGGHSSEPPDISMAFNDRSMTSIKEPDELVFPWKVRLWRANTCVSKAPKSEKADAERDFRDLKARIAQLPERTRWAVVVHAHLDGETGARNLFYSEEETTQVLQFLSAELRASILDGSVDLSIDPYLKANDGANARRVIEEAKRLLSHAPDGKTAEPG